VGELRRLGATLAVAVALAPAAAHADPDFGAHDVRTVFFISKSDDRNRVDYGVRLDARCQPVGETPVYAYWHRFEPGQPIYGDLNSMDRRVYGVRQQRVHERNASGTWIEIRLAAVTDERILILVRPGDDGCVAAARIQVRGRDALLDHVHVQLARLFGVEHVTVHGRDPDTGAEVTERRTP